MKFWMMNKGEFILQLALGSASNEPARVRHHEIPFIVFAKRLV